ncbi:MAG: hypothetical protein ACXW1P_06335 [Methylophilaceae bacterium]
MNKIYLRYFAYLLTYFLISCGQTSGLMQEVEKVYAISGNNEQVNELVNQYFPSGMEAQIALKQLSQDGFEITEFSEEGTKTWPDGDIKPFASEEIKNKFIKSHPKEVKSFMGEKSFRHSIFEKNTLNIGIDSKNKKILKVRAALYSQTI